MNLWKYKWFTKYYWKVYFRCKNNCFVLWWLHKVYLIYFKASQIDTGFPKKDARLLKCLKSLFHIILPSLSSLTRSGTFLIFEKRASFLGNPVHHGPLSFVCYEMTDYRQSSPLWKSEYKAGPCCTSQVWRGCARKRERGNRLVREIFLYPKPLFLPLIIQSVH